MEPPRFLSACISAFWGGSMKSHNKTKTLQLYAIK
jgi:hypothetical protein